ncbi:MAG: hypothetical protein ACKPAC_04260, partial [Alphaproteobacteria bacterium]
MATLTEHQLFHFQVACTPIVWFASNKVKWMAFSEAHPLTLPQKALNKQRHLRGGTTMLDLSRRLLLGSAAAAP